MAKRSENKFELGEVSAELAKRFLPRPLKDGWLVLPEPGIRWTVANAAALSLLAGLLLGALLSKFLATSHLIWIALVLFSVPLGIKKFVVGPLEDEYEALANEALRDRPTE